MAIRDEWFSDDLKKLDDDYIYRKLQGHWIIEMPEMIATSGAKSIEEIKAFLSRQKDTYKTPYLVHPEDRPRQCVFAGTTNRLDFLPRDRSGNRRFLPVFVCPEKAEQHPLQDEAASRAYIDQMWAEIMRIRSTGMYSLCLGRESEQQLADRQEAFSQEDYRAGIILGFLREYRGDRVCSRQLFREALDNRYEEPGDQDIRNIREIVDTGIASGKIRGWQRTAYPVRFPGYGTQRGWERRKEDRKAPEQLSFIEARHVPGNPWEERE